MSRSVPRNWPSIPQVRAHNTMVRVGVVRHGPNYAFEMMCILRYGL